MESVTDRVVSGFPDKMKFVIGPPTMTVPEPASEILLITLHSQDETFLTLILKTLNKRQQTLDLISMMKELKRTWCGRSVHNDKQRLRIIDRLLSFPKFKKESDKTD